MGRNWLIRALLRSSAASRPVPTSLRSSPPRLLNQDFSSSFLFSSSPLPSSTTSFPMAPISRDQQHSMFFRRSFCSSGPSNVVMINSSETFNTLLNKVQDDNLPAVFYYTAAWCGPCKFISPFIGDLSKKYPHVSIYKIDVDEEGLGKALSQLQISSVPTFHFFQDGKRASELNGADVAQLRSIMEKLYTQNSS